MHTRIPTMLPTAALLALAAMTTACSTLEGVLAAPMSEELHDGLPARHQVQVPQPASDGAGSYAAPFTRSGELAPWAADALEGAEPASFLGAVRPQNASWWSTGVEVLTGERAPVEVNAATLESAGGWARVHATSDATFHDVDDLAVYLYAMHGDDERYVRVLKVTQDLYPGLGPAYREAIRRASIKGAQAPTKGYIRAPARAR